MKGEGPISLYKGIASLHDASGPGSLTFILGQLALIVHCDFLDSVVRSGVPLRFGLWGSPPHRPVNQFTCHPLALPVWAPL